MRRGTRIVCAALLVAAATPLPGCAEIAGLKDREVGTSGGAGGSSGAAGGGCAPSGAGEATPIVIASNEAKPRAIALDGDSIYWTTEGLEEKFHAIRKAPKGCVPAPPIDLVLTGPKTPFAIAVDEIDVYWSNAREGACDADGLPTADQVRRIAKSGSESGMGAELWSGCGRPDTVSLDATSAYWARPKAHRVQRWKKDGSDLPKELFNGNGSGEPLGVVADDQFVYWSDPSGKTITAYDKQGMAPTALFTGDEKPGLMAVDADGVYWLTESGVMRGNKGTAPADAAVIATDIVEPGGIAVHGAYVYVTDANRERILRISKDGSGTPRDLATNQQNPLGIAVDDTGVYWTNHGDGSIMKLPLPAD